MLASIFGPGSVRTIGALGLSLEARGPYRGSPLRVELRMSQTRRSGVQPFTVIELEDDLDVSVFSGGAGWPYPSHEPYVPFQAPRLADQAMAGAPRALLGAIATGPIAEALAASGVQRLTLGSDAKRDGCATRGVHLVVEGWPLDTQTLVALLDTAWQLGAEARRALGDAAPYGRASGARHPEVVAYEVARARSRAQGLKIVAVVMVVMGLLVAAGLLAFAATMRP